MGTYITGHPAPTAQHMVFQGGGLPSRLDKRATWKDAQLSQLDLGLHIRQCLPYSFSSSPRNTVINLRIAPRAEACETVVHTCGLGFRPNVAVIHASLPDSVCVVVERILLTFHKLDDKLQQGDPVFFWGGGSQALHQHTPNTLRMIPSRARLRAGGQRGVDARGRLRRPGGHREGQTDQTDFARHIHWRRLMGWVFTKDGIQQPNTWMRMGDIAEAGNNSVAARTSREGYDSPCWHVPTYITRPW